MRRGRPLVRLDQAVAQPNHTRRSARDLVGMGDEQHGVAAGVQILDQTQDLLTRLGVEVSGRLVGEQDRRAVDQRPGDGDPLALPATELVGLVVHAVREPDRLERFDGALAPLLGRYPRVNERQGDVVEGGRSRQQVEGLEHEADLAVPDVGELIVVETRDLPLVEAVGRKILCSHSCKHW